MAKKKGPASIKELLGDIPPPSGEMEDDVMLDPEYLRASSKLISQALQEGDDVLQLENGDVVVTGTKVVVTQYRWDSQKGKLVKMTAKERKDAAARAKKK